MTESLADHLGWNPCLEQQGGVGVSIVAALNRAYRVFDGVTLDRNIRFIEDRYVSGRAPLPQVRSYYRPVLDVCYAIISQQSVSLDRDTGDVGPPSLVIEMSRALELYIRNALVADASRSGWSHRVLDGNHKPPGGGERPLFDDGGATSAAPEVVIADASGEHPRIVEVKYKPSSKSLDRSDLHQAIAYRARDVLVVPPRVAVTIST